MRSLRSGLRKKRSFPVGESYFGFALRQTHLKIAIFAQNHASFIATNLVIEYIEYINSLPEAKLVIT
jgi:hypothetical protein